MSLQSYKKTDIRTYETELVSFEGAESKNLNNIRESFLRLRNYTRSSKSAGILFPLILVLTGSIFIYREVFPEIQQVIQEKLGYYTLGNLSPVDESYINIADYISRPSNFSNLTTEALSQHILEQDDVSSKYSGMFTISIPSLGINKVPVKANVDSTTEASYMSVLDQSLAHFKGTSLPISDVKNNIVVYGHSASTSYNPQPSDPMVAFSYLPNLKVGDEIIIEMDGEKFEYKMYRSKIVEPNDTSIITGTKGRSTLTLFTCFPLGSNAKRYIAVARPS